MSRKPQFPGTFLFSVRYIYSLLTSVEKRKFFTLSFFQMILGLLDISGVAAIGLLGSLAVNGIQSKPGGTKVQWLLTHLGIGSLTLQWQVAILGLMAGSLLIMRTILSIFLTRQVLFFLSGKAALISGEMASNVISNSYQQVKSIPKQRLLFSISSGVNLLFIGVLGNLTSLGSDVFLLGSMLITLMVVDPTVAISTIILFGSIAVTLYFTLQKKARNLGIENAALTVQNNESILDALQLFREIQLRNLQSEYSREIFSQRMKLATNNARSAFLPNISKYVIEIALVAGTVLIAASQFIQRDATHAISVLSIFLASGSRIAPAILRIQQNAISMKSALGAAGETIDFLKFFEIKNDARDSYLSSDKELVEHPPKVEFKNVFFSYSGETEVLKDINFEINEGESIALIGPSGSGKSTLVDLLLGMLQPTIGTVKVDGQTPLEVATRRPGYLAYVPQNIHIFNGTVAQNITLSQSGNVDLRDLGEAISQSSLESLISSFETGVEKLLGENGNNLSGGQKQRIGIARALYTKPKLMVLDEATSSLDGITEMDITNLLGNLKGQVTTVIIAHRLTSIINCDRIIYLDQGIIREVGTLDELKKKIPDLDKQIQNMLSLG